MTGDWCSAVEATQRIAKRHQPIGLDGVDVSWCDKCERPAPCEDHADAGVVLDRLTEATEALGVIVRMSPTSQFASIELCQQKAEQALRALNGDNT